VRLEALWHGELDEEGCAHFLAPRILVTICHSEWIGGMAGWGVSRAFAGSWAGKLMVIIIVTEYSIFAGELNSP